MSLEHLENLHGASGKQEVLPEGKDQLQGVQQAGMPINHHTLLHWALIMAHLFQV
jgi:hypothetical protein